MHTSRIGKVEKVWDVRRGIKYILDIDITEMNIFTLVVGKLVIV